MSTKIKAKIDYGRKAYEEEIAREPNYQATGRPRPKWDELSLAAQEAWRTKAKHDA
jgi:hypothetical protein